MWLDAHYNLPITYGTLDTESYWQAARSCRSARTADTISDRVLCVLHLFNSLFFSAYKRQDDTPSRETKNWQDEYNGNNNVGTT
jgi:hypothetical protein